MLRNTSQVNDPKPALDKHHLAVHALRDTRLSWDHPSVTTTKNDSDRDSSHANGSDAKSSQTKKEENKDRNFTVRSHNSSMLSWDNPRATGSSGADDTYVFNQPIHENRNDDVYFSFYYSCIT